VSLSPAERSAARAFRDSQRAALQRRDSPGITVSVLIRHYRHDCAARGGKSGNLELHEHYVFSPDRRFGFIYTEGRCPACSTTARSGDTRLVDTRIRPPAPRAVVHGG
jgi:hypothetical protein